ncbi:MAG TPA: prephenate dehydratase [Acidimicrobiaceae bacterium]|nr:prephenate dehydratase [Acidimicrobiaceae bacterium]HCK73967.1 prephenate dehydratase [Acidimicrobiaceae bacterium]
MSTNQPTTNIELVPAATRVGFMGPHGTFTEQALLSQPDLAAADTRPFDSIPDVLNGLVTGEVDLGFVPIENAIEGAVNVTQDALAFDLDLRIQREVVLDVQLNLLALPGTQLADIHTVVSFPVAVAQCRSFLREHIPDAEIQAATSTAEAARQVGEQRLEGVATISNPLAAELYGLEAIAEAVEDHTGNQTRFLLLAREGVPGPTGHDKTSVVVFQRANEPGSLLAILHEFAARNIDLSRLESRPTRRVLGDYCFLLDFEGHIGDEVVADCLRDLKMKQGDIKFLGSYPAAGHEGEQVRRENDANWRDAADWVQQLRDQIGL